MNKGLKHILRLAAVLILLAAAACAGLRPASTTGSPATSPGYTAAPGATPAAQVPVVEIPLAGPAAAPEAELSGLGWHGDTLVLLPQYPERFAGQASGALFGLPRQEILDFLDGKNAGPLTPQAIPLDTAGIEKLAPGFQGFESLAFDGERFYMTIEAGSPGKMMGYVVAGSVDPDLKSARLDPATLTPNPPQLNRSNKSDEALLVDGQDILTLYEVNGAALNPAPQAARFSLALQPEPALPLPNIEYRITDATPPDAQGRFWASNYFFPGDSDLKPKGDPLAPGGAAPTGPVERLVEFQIKPEGIVFSGAAPVWLALRQDGEARNWEGLARLPGRGFLLATDKYPATILGFVAYP